MKMYCVILTSAKNDDEVELLMTNNIQKAKERAGNEKYYIERDRRVNDYVEIRAYEDEESFDYDIIEI